MLVNKINTQRMPNLRRKMSLVHPMIQNQNYGSVIADIEATIERKEYPQHMSDCNCRMCGDERFEEGGKGELPKVRSSGAEATKLLKRVLQGLSNYNCKTLKLHIPDLFFVQGDSIQIFQTSRQGRILKLSGSIPPKMLYTTIVRMRKQYKSQLQNNFTRKMYDKLDPQYLHMKYYDKLLPSSFHAGVDSTLLDANKHAFRRYVLHSDSKYQISAIEEHKMNDKEPFCLITYLDGNSQLLNQLEFQMFSLTFQGDKIQEVLYLQSYIKYRGEGDAILYSEYCYDSKNMDVEVEKRAEKDVMVLVGGLGKYDEGYRDPESIEEIDFELMISDPQKYVEMITYKIVHFLAMASRIYVSRLKIKWIINDIGAVYLQQIMECVITEFPKRMVRYRVPKKEEQLDFYSNGGNFIDIYKEMKKRRTLNKLIIKKEVDGKTYEELLEIMNPEMKREWADKRERDTKETTSLHVSKQRPKLSQTIDVVRSKRSRPNNASTYEQHLREHPQFATRNMRYNSVTLGRYAPQRSKKLDNNINNHFLYHMSSQDRKVLCSNGSNFKGTMPESRIQKYIQKKKEKLSESMLYSTFSRLNEEKMKEVGGTLQKEKIGRRLKHSTAR